MTNKNTDKIVKLAKEKSEIKTQKVLEIINEMASKKETISFYKVSQASGVSRNFLYTNTEIRKVIDSFRKNAPKKNQSQDAKDIIIEAQKRKIKSLEKQIKELEGMENWKEKYKQLVLENTDLKKQLKKSYNY